VTEVRETSGRLRGAGVAIGGDGATSRLLEHTSPDDSRHRRCCLSTWEPQPRLHGRPAFPRAHGRPTVRTPPLLRGAARRPLPATRLGARLCAPNGNGRCGGGCGAVRSHVLKHSQLFAVAVAKALASVRSPVVVSLEHSPPFAVAVGSPRNPTPLPCNGGPSDDTRATSKRHPEPIHRNTGRNPLVGDDSMTRPPIATTGMRSPRAASPPAPAGRSRGRRPPRRRTPRSRRTPRPRCRWRSSPSPRGVRPRPRP